MIDPLAIVPTYIGLVFPGAHVLIDVRIPRLLRILKLSSYVREYGPLGRAPMHCGAPPPPYLHDELASEQGYC
ncbi:MULTISPECIES: hypothetical protein [unclassified Janthinobacterium]|uniref:hypothetical protein n=1 Tax=unclassified Janthinobacterium TaxID=2610881 RepID=UPI00034D4AF9|nr:MULTISPECIES: hypothetical protein [unclassified Janthinobacterium]MEC5159726.1 hypothetical protein [Janthinobacterium sp. CG_S6]